MMDGFKDWCACEAPGIETLTLQDLQDQTYPNRCWSTIIFNYHKQISDSRCFQRSKLDCITKKTMRKQNSTCWECTIYQEWWSSKSKVLIKQLHNWPTRQHPTKKSIRVDIRRIIQLIQKFSPPRGISLARLCSWPRRALVLPPAHGTTQGAGPGARDVVGFSMGFTRPGKRSQKTMEHPPIVHGKIHYFYGHFQ